MTALEMPRVLLVMKTPGNLRVMQQALVRSGMPSVTACNEVELDALLAELSFTIHLGLVDVSGFGDAAWRMCRKLQARNLPFILLSTPQEIETGGRSLQYGAHSVLQKPVAKSALLQLVRSFGAWNGKQQGGKDTGEWHE